MLLFTIIKMIMNRYYGWVDPRKMYELIFNQYHSFLLNPKMEGEYFTVYSSTLGRKGYERMRVVSVK